MQIILWFIPALAVAGATQPAQQAASSDKDSALAASEGRPEEQWILARTLEELKFIHDWLPADGTSHEGPSYIIFGGPHLALAMQACDRGFGTDSLGHPFFRSVPRFRLHSLTPGLKDAFHFGDSAGLGGYILILDDIRAAKEAEIAYLVQGPKLETVDQAAQRYALVRDGVRCEFQVAGSIPLAAAVVDSTADHRGKPLGWRQLQLRGKATALRIASLYDPWARGGARAAMKADGEAAAVTVTAGGAADEWAWQPPADNASPSRLTCRRGGKVLVELSAKDAPATQTASP